MLALGARWTFAELTVDLEPCPAPSLVVLRVALDDADIGADVAGALRIRCALDSAPDRPLLERELPFAELSAERHWVPIVLSLAPTGSNERLTLALERTPGGANVLVTPGVRCVVPATRERRAEVAVRGRPDAGR